jgi:Mitochondrial ribosomal protein L37
LESKMTMILLHKTSYAKTIFTRQLILPASSRSSLLSMSTASSGLARPTVVASLPMKPGEPLQALKIFKNQDAPVVLERHEYPDWINNLAQKDISLAQLRRMDEADATDREKMRFLKLTRRLAIRQKNEASKKK